jgi:hypothetical protein
MVNRSAVARFLILFSLLLLTSCSSRQGTTRIDNPHFESPTGSKFSADKVELAQQFRSRVTMPDGTQVELNLQSDRYTVALDAQEKAALIKAGELVRDLGGKGLALWLTSGSSEAVSFLAAVAKSGIQLSDQEEQL